MSYGSHQKMWHPALVARDVFLAMPPTVAPLDLWTWLCTGLAEAEGMTPIEWIFAGRTPQTLVLSASRLGTTAT